MNAARESFLAQPSICYSVTAGAAKTEIPVFAGDFVINGECNKYRLIVKHAYSECQGDGFWHVVTDAYYTCDDPPGGVFGPHRIGDIPTEQRCGPGGNPAVGLLDLLDLVLPRLGSDFCVGPRKVDEFMLIVCVNGVWERHVYEIYECADGSRRRLQISTEVTNIDCETPLGPFNFGDLIRPLPTGFSFDGPRLQRLPSQEVRLETTRIGDVYSITAETAPRLIALVDPSTATAHVAEEQSEKAAELFHAEAAAPGVWVLNYPQPETKYRVAPLDAATLERPIVAEQAFAIQGRQCRPVAKGACINFYTPTGKFAYSWSAVRDTEMCFIASDHCLETWQRNAVTLHPLPDCKGKAFRANKTWAFCVSP